MIHMRREHRVEPGTVLVSEAVGPDEGRVHFRRFDPKIRVVRP